MIATKLISPSAAELIRSHIDQITNLPLTRGAGEPERYLHGYAQVEFGFTYGSPDPYVSDVCDYSEFAYIDEHKGSPDAVVVEQGDERRVFASLDEALKAEEFGALISEDDWTTRVAYNWSRGTRILGEDDQGRVVGATEVSLHSPDADVTDLNDPESLGDLRVRFEWRVNESGVVDAIYPLPTLPEYMHAPLHDQAIIDAEARWQKENMLCVIRDRGPNRAPLIREVDWNEMREKLVDTAAGWVPEVMQLFSMHQGAKDDALFDRLMGRRLLNGMAEKQSARAPQPGR